MKSSKRTNRPSVGRKLKASLPDKKTGSTEQGKEIFSRHSRPISNGLTQMLSELKPHDHLCLIYETPEERADIATAFISTGLKKGEKCFYVVDANTAQDILIRLEKHDSEIKSATQSGQLTILNEINVYQNDGSFSPDKMISFLVMQAEKAVAEKYPALRIIFDMICVLHNSKDANKLLEYEAKLNRDFLSKYPCIIIGQYDRWEFRPEIIKGVIMTHPLAIRGKRIYHNFYYVPPVEFLNVDRAELEVRHCLDNLERMEVAWESLWKSEQKLKSIFRVAPTGIGMVVNRVLVEANDRFCEIMGYSREELINKPPDEIYASYSEFDFVGKEKYRQIGEKGTGSVETKLKRKDGTIVDVFMSSTPIDATDLSRGVVFTVLDITDYKRAERALEDEATKHRILIEQSRDGIVILDQEGGVYEANKRFADMLGYAPEEMPNLHVWDWDYQWEPQHLLAMIRTVDEKGDNFETRHKRKDGSIYDVEISTNGAMYAGQKLIFCVCRDVTDRKRAEAALHESEEKYRQLVENAAEAIFILQDGMIKFANQRTADIIGYSLENILDKPFAGFIYPDDRQMVVERYNQRLSGLNVISTYPFRVVCKSSEVKWVEISVIKVNWQGKTATLNFGSDITERKQLEAERQRIDKLESVGTLAGGIAHDFNNILTGILGNISLAIMKAKANDDIEDILKEAEKASLRAKDLTQQLLTFARGGAPVKALTPVDTLIKDTVGFALRGANVNCKYSLQSDLWQAEIDEGQIGQVISNLILNARQSMPMGGDIKVSAGNVTISSGRYKDESVPLPDGDYIRIEVADHGIGIPRQHVDRIFDPYFTTKQSGSGLGLATCYSIVHNHGGYIGVESEVGVGSKFYFYLPASKAKVAPAKMDISAGLAFTGGRILVMDDEEVVKDIAGRMLEHIGYQDIAFAADGDEAIRLYREGMETGKPFSVVILDLTIPGGMGGAETIKKLREIDPEIKAIVSSGYSDNKIMAQYKEFGFQAVVAKPYTLEQLSKALLELQSYNPLTLPRI